MDRRSFDLNYENNILLVDADLTSAVYQRQRQYLDHSRRVTLDEIAQWNVPHRLMNNAVAMFGPVL